MKSFCYLLLFYCISILPVAAQSPIFEGGVSAGYGNNCFIQPTALGAYIYNGGKEDGVAVSCHQQPEALGTAIFFGGNDDGFVNSCFLQEIYPSTPGFYAAFGGGIEDGVAVNCFEQKPALGVALFFGGNDDGFVSSCFIQGTTLITPTFYGAFGGGFDDGFAVNCFEQPSALGVALFYGGNDDGFVNACFLQELPYPGFYGAFGGGIENGFAVNCHQQTNAAGYAIFNGGNDTENFVLCYQQTSTTSVVFNGGNDNNSNGVTCFEQPNYVTASYYYGGNDDYATILNCFEQPSNSTSFFYGGNDDGFSNSCFTQGVIISNTFSQFTGGISGSNTVSCHSQLPALGNQIFFGGKSSLIVSTCYKQPDYLIKVILPIELLNFNAEIVDDNKVEVNWQTASEANTDYFIVQRSADTYKWEEIKKVKAKGNSNILNSYITYDKKPLNGRSYYRLKQVDKNGFASYSLIESVDFENKLNLDPEFLVYPNPTDYLVNLQFTNFKTDNLDVYIMDLNGKIVYQKSITLIDGTGLFGFERLENMATGNYIISVFQKNERVANKKLIVQ